MLDSFEEVDVCTGRNGVARQPMQLRQVLPVRHSQLRQSLDTDVRLQIALRRGNRCLDHFLVAVEDAERLVFRLILTLQAFGDDSLEQHPAIVRVQLAMLGHIMATVY